MSLLHGFAASLFRQATDGRRLFVPYTYLGPQYLLATPSAEQRVQAGIVRFYALALPPTTLPILVFGPAILFLTLPGYLAAYALCARSLARGLSRVGAGETRVGRSTVPGRLRTFGAATSRLWLVGLITVSVAVGLFGVWLGVRDADGDGWAIAALGAAHVAVWGYAIRAHYADRRGSESVPQAAP